MNIRVNRGINFIAARVEYLIGVGLFVAELVRKRLDYLVNKRVNKIGVIVGFFKRVLRGYYFNLFGLCFFVFFLGYIALVVHFVQNGRAALLIRLRVIVRRVIGRAFGDGGKAGALREG